MTVARRILLNVALGAALVIAIVAAVTYRLVYDGAEARAVEQLNTYVSQRKQREEARFELVYNNLEIVIGLFRRKQAQPIPADLEAQWNAQIKRYPDGAWRSDRQLCDPLHHANLWSHRDVELTPRLKFRMLNAMRTADELMPMWEQSFPSCFIMFPWNGIAGFNPMQPEWVWETPADYPLIEQEWYFAADPTHNPSHTYVWTGVVPDPISGIPYFTLLAPIMAEDGEHLCTLGHDVHMDHLFTEITHSDFPGAVHLIFRADGRIIAHPKLREAILKSEGLLKVNETGDPSLANLYAQATGHGGGQLSGFEPVSKSYFSSSRLKLPGAEWFFVTLLPQEQVRAQALHSAKWVWISGGVSLALLFAAFGAILRRQVTRPLAELTRATKAMSAGEVKIPKVAPRADELGALAESFSEMVAKVVARENDLRELNLDLEKRVVARTEDLHRALSRERELGEMKGNFVSLVTHEFRTPLGVIMSAVEVLQRYFDRIPPEKRTHHLHTIFRSTKNLAALIDEVLLLSRVEQGRLAFEPAPLDLDLFCRTIVDELRSATNEVCPIHLLSKLTEHQASSDERVLRHILPNLLSNAVKYSDPGQPVHLEVRREEENAVFQIRDQGIGIPKEDQERLFTSFTRGGNVGERPGTGLGLVVVQRCVALHGGTLHLDSEPGRGTTVTVALPVFRGSTE